MNETEARESFRALPRPTPPDPGPMLDEALRVRRSVPPRADGWIAAGVVLLATTALALPSPPAGARWGEGLRARSLELATAVAAQLGGGAG